MPRPNTHSKLNSALIYKSVNKLQQKTEQTVNKSHSKVESEAE